ncbi:hypothetical protein ACFOSC_10425 [Streptantibioticus rubrisoli]|uniref:Uncharacterized protein n=1 Tax=Streptantibioticus rubrisoli TaxID=1387313 RepID=A0ABT1PBI4_9ACTN|nr:hypothetical protein [Streptantibioticus rubrisoli]MCQ4042727.1 hypothetical protein [Streptantibioticus rubrisoli]
MAGFRDFLMRFRPASAPGPTATGVPADRSAELAAELAPPLALLEEAETEARTIRESAAEEARRIRRDGDLRAARLVAEAQERAASLWQETAAQTRAAAEREAAELLASGDRAVTALRRRARERMPGLVDLVVAEVRHGLEGSGPDAEGRPRWAPDGSPG